MSKEFLIKYIPVNKSGGEVILSIGEGLLLVLDAYRELMKLKRAINEKRG